MIKSITLTTKTASLFIALLLMGQASYTQSLDNLKDQQPVTLTGYVSTNQVINNQPVDSGKNYHYSGYYTGSLNFNIYGVSVPLTFVYTNQQTDFSHPFNQYGMHPSYKWIRGHIGYASMSFTPYTLNGHLFLGAGVEVDPEGLFHASAMYGRLKRAVEPDIDSASRQGMGSYRRMGYGIKAGIGKGGDLFDITMFRAYDEENSIENFDTALSPMENSVVSASVSKVLFQNISFSGEYATSLMTTDTRSETTEGAALMKPSSWFMPTKQSTISRDALKANITYKHTRFSIGAGYERVDPEYATLGAYYFTNNLENITMNASTNFFENMVNLSGNVGLQRDNLDNNRMNTSTRWVGAGSLGVMPTEKLNMNFSYSNFTGYTNVKSTFEHINETDPLENYDTLEFRQISQNVNFSGNYSLGGEGPKSQSIGLNLNWQQSSDVQEGEADDNTHFYNAGISHNLGLSERDMSITTNINFNRNDVSENPSFTWGPSISVTKSFFEKTLRANIYTGYNSSSVKGMSTTNVFNIRSGISYSLRKQHSFNLNIMLQERFNKGEGTGTRKKATATLTFGYVYNFRMFENGFKDIRKNKSPQSEENEKE